MTTTPGDPLRDEDLETVPGAAGTGPGPRDTGRTKDADGTDGGDADSADADGTDGGDADSTDSSDSDSTDADGTDA